MKTIYKNLILGSTVALVGGSIAAVFASHHRLAQEKRQIVQRDLKDLNEIQQKIYKLNNQETISLDTLKKSFKMSVDLYRGGDFDFSKIQLPFIKAKSMSHDEFIKLIDDLSTQEALSLRTHFKEIVFKKKILVAPKYLYEINSSIKHGADLQTLKEKFIHEYIEQQESDNSFVSTDTWTESILQYTFDIKEYKKFITYLDNGKELTEQQLIEKINAFTDIEQLKDYISEDQNEPLFSINLSDELLINFESILPKQTYSTKFNSGNENISIFHNKSTYDNVYGNMTEWMQLRGFDHLYFWDNAISPLVNLGWSKEQNGSVDETKNDLIENKVTAKSIDYSLPLNFSQIIDYKQDNHKIHKSMIPLNTNRYLENKLHASQSERFGIQEFSNINIYRENMFRDWVPHFKQQFFSMWQYTNAYVEWGGYRNTLNLPSPTKIDIAHKNGVKAYATLFNDEPTVLMMRLMAQRENGTNIFIRNLIQALKDRGADGLFWNAEIAGWKSNGLNDSQIVIYQQFLRDADKAFTESGLTFQCYTNTNSEIPVEPDKAIDYFNGRNGVSSSSVNGIPNKFTDKTYVREGHTVPASALMSMYHFDHNFDIVDQKLGIGANNELFLGFVNKINIVRGAAARVEFAKNHPEYTLTTMGWNSKDGGSASDYLWKEWNEIQTKNLAPEYYGNYAEYGSAQAHSEESEWEMGTFTSRIDTPRTVGMLWQDDFNELKEWSLAHDDEHGSLPAGQTNPIWIYDSLSRDPRTSSKAYSNFFQEKSGLKSDNFSTSFEIGFGNKFDISGVSKFNGWANVGIQDFMPTYRYIIDEYDSNGNKVDLSSKNYIGRKVEAHIDSKKDAYFGSNTLHYTGTLKPNEAFENKLYVTEVDSNKQFKMIVSSKVANKTKLAIWKNKQDAATYIAASSVTQLNDKFTELTFNVDASVQDKVTSFGLYFKNDSLIDVDLDDLVVDGISYGANSSHTLTNFSAESNNENHVGANVTFDDGSFDELTRYIVKDANGLVISITSRPEFHIENEGKYTVDVMNCFGETLTTKEINISKGEV